MYEQRPEFAKFLESNWGWGPREWAEASDSDRNAACELYAEALGWKKGARDSREHIEPDSEVADAEPVSIERSPKPPTPSEDEGVPQRSSEGNHGGEEEAVNLREQECLSRSYRNYFPRVSLTEKALRRLHALRPSQRQAYEAKFSILNQGIFHNSNTHKVKGLSEMISIVHVGGGGRIYHRRTTGTTECLVLLVGNKSQQEGDCEWLRRNAGAEEFVSRGARRRQSAAG
jgi:hypothetical protein